MTSVLWYMREARALMKRFSWGSCRVSNHNSSRAADCNGNGKFRTRGSTSQTFSMTSVSPALESPKIQLPRVDMASVRLSE